MNGTELYQRTDEDVVRTYRRVHGNGEQTRVAIISVGERDYASIAYDIAPADFTPIAAEIIAYDPTVEGAMERTERWMQENPKGVLQAVGGDDSGGGTLSKLTTVAGKLNDYGNALRENAQQPQQGKQMVNEDNNE